MQNTCKIKEIFSSIQGEGPYLGQLHIFVRFCSCNLNCSYCDTDFSSNETYSIDELNNILQKLDGETISYTGGEPLIEVDFLYNFLKKYKNSLNKKIYLETNGTLYSSLDKIIDYIDIVSMDIKLKSATGQENRFSDNKKFLSIASKKEVFVKIVFDNNIDDTEIDNCVSIVKKYNCPIILQPKMPMDKDLNLQAVFDKFYKKYKQVRLIPQNHKFLNLK